jgi:hypothetical protein
VDMFRCMALAQNVRALEVSKRRFAVGFRGRSTGSGHLGIVGNSECTGHGDV